MVARLARRGGCGEEGVQCELSMQCENFEQVPKLYKDDLSLPKLIDETCPRHEKKVHLLNDLDPRPLGTSDLDFENSKLSLAFRSRSSFRPGKQSQHILEIICMF